MNNPMALTAKKATPTWMDMDVSIKPQLGMGGKQVHQLSLLIPGSKQRRNDQNQHSAARTHLQAAEPLQSNKPMVTTERSTRPRSETSPTTRVLPQ